MSIFVTHPTGNKNVRAVAEALFANGLLREFGTTIAADPDNKLLALLPQKLRAEFLRRTYNIPQDLIWTYPWLELVRMFSSKFGVKTLIKHETGAASVDAVYKQFDNKAAVRLKYLNSKYKVGAVYAYEDGALSTFKTAKALGIKCVYDLPIAYWQTGRNLMAEEASRLPEWAITLGGGIKDSEQKLERKRQELELADVVVTASTFVKNSLPGFAANKQIVLSPFGSPNHGFVDIDKMHDLNQPLRVLFVGSMGQRKGLGDLFAAMKLLEGIPVELVVMGSLLAPMEFYKSQLNTFTYESGRPNQEVLALMRSCDVFCLPSIVEGRALVMQEAMSQGLPLIITANTGGEDLIVEGETGFLVPIRSPEIIAEKIKWFATHRAETAAMGKNARVHAAKYTWESYARTIIESIKS